MNSHAVRGTKIITDLLIYPALYFHPVIGYNFQQQEAPQ